MEGSVCVYGAGASTGLCVEPDEDHGALPPPPPPGPRLSVSKDVDILFVIDNSGSMGEEQAILVQSFASFISVLGIVATGMDGAAGMDRGMDLETALREAIFDGALGEGAAAMEALEGARSCEDPRRLGTS